MNKMKAALFLRAAIEELDMLPPPASDNDDDAIDTAIDLLVSLRGLGNGSSTGPTRRLYTSQTIENQYQLSTWLQVAYPDFRWVVDEIDRMDGRVYSARAAWDTQGFVGFVRSESKSSGYFTLAVLIDWLQAEFGDPSDEAPALTL